MADVSGPVRNKIRAAAKQLKPLTGSGRPLVIVLANPGGACVGLGPRDMVWAMCGDPAFSFTADSETGGLVGESGFIVTRNGKLRNDHPYISRCRRSRGDVPDGHYHRLDAYRTMSAEAASLPAEVFNGPKDRLIEFDAEVGACAWTDGRPRTQLVSLASRTPAPLPP